MNMNEYQREAALTAVYPKDIGLAYTALGLTGESGEVADKIKKIYRDKNGELSQDDRMALVKELGDVLWYVAMVAEELDVHLGFVAKTNLSKLSSRFERGVIKGVGDDR